MIWLKQLLLSLLAIALLIEEWLWDVLTLFGRWLSQRLRLDAFEQWLSRSSRWVALGAFMVPVLVVMPMNLVAFWLIAKGAVLRGVLLEILAKLLGTVLIARVFALTKPQLLTFKWFARFYAVVVRMLGWAHARVASTAVYRGAKHLKARIKQLWKRSAP